MLVLIEIVYCNIHTTINIENPHGLYKFWPRWLR